MLSEKVIFLFLSCALMMASTNVIYRADDYDERLDDKGLDRSRTKRYPAHLEPNVMAMGAKFWIRPGECPPSLDGDTKYFCPYPNPSGRFSCLDSWELCDGVKNCPGAADEDPMHCLFYKATQSQLQTLFAAQRKQQNDAASIGHTAERKSNSPLSFYYTNKK